MRSHFWLKVSRRKSIAIQSVRTRDPKHSASLILLVALASTVIIMGRVRSDPSAKPTRRKAVVTKAASPSAILPMLQATHQFSLVGGEDYEPKERRLEQILHRLPQGSGKVIIFTDKKACSKVSAIVDRHRQSQRHLISPPLKKLRSEVDSNASTRASSSSDSDSDATLTGGSGCDHSGLPFAAQISVMSDEKHVQLENDVCQYIVNYSFPTSGRKYLERMKQLCSSSMRPGIVITFVEDDNLQTRGCSEIKGLLRRAKQAAETKTHSIRKVPELKAALTQLEGEDEDEDEDEEDAVEDDDDDLCHCRLCQGRTKDTIANQSYHALNSQGMPMVEFVRVHVSALQDMARVAPLIAPRLQDYACTVICLHALHCHDNWDGSEHLFAIPHGLGIVRVINVLAEEGSFHEYPDSGTLIAGVPWFDILDMESLDKTDQLIANLVEHEVKLLNGHSQRVLLMGVSQGGIQAMLRFIRSRHELGGFIGCVTHVPTMPHTSQHEDPLLDWRSGVNRNRPVRILAGEADSTIPPALVLRDADRMRDVGGFTDIQVEVRKNLNHDGYLPAKNIGKHMKRKRSVPVTQADKDRTESPDVFHLLEHLPAMLGA